MALVQIGGEYCLKLWKVFFRIVEDYQAALSGVLQKML